MSSVKHNPPLIVALANMYKYWAKIGESFVQIASEIELEINSFVTIDTYTYRVMYKMH